MEPGKCKLWRISFSAAEKDIILSCDGSLKASDEKTNRKDVLRLLKDDIEQLNKEQVRDRKVLCSFHAKTVFLRCLDEFHRDSDWKNIRDRYVAALKMLVDCLERGHMSHYFISGVNLLDRSNVSAAQWNRVVRYFSDVIAQFDKGSARVEVVPSRGVRGANFLGW